MRTPRDRTLVQPWSLRRSLADPSVYVGCCSQIRVPGELPPKAAKLLGDTSKFVECEKGLTFVGYAGIKDPARPEVAESIAQCKAAGLVPSGSFYVHLVNSRLRLKEFSQARELFDEMQAAGHLARGSFRQRVLKLTSADEPKQMD